MSKGGTTSGSTEIPAWLENAAIENINKARDVSQIGYTPYYGPDVAAFNPMQTASFDATGAAANAFGLGGGSPTFGTDGIQAPQTFAGGMRGYSSAPIYEQALSQLEQNRPAQYSAINDMFIDPFTGAKPQGNYAATPEQVSQMFNNGNGDGAGGGKSPYGNDANMEHLARMAAAGASDGDYYGVNSDYNPYEVTTPTIDISGDGVVDYRDMSMGEAGRVDPSTTPIFDGLIDLINPFSGIPKIIDAVQGIPFHLSGAGDASMTPAQATAVMNAGADAYAPRLAASTIEAAPTDRGYGMLTVPSGPAAYSGEAALKERENLGLLSLLSVPSAPAPMTNYSNDMGYGSGYNAMAAPPVQAVSPLLTTTQMNPTLFNPAANAALKAIYESSIGGRSGNGSNRDNDYSGGGGTSSAAMGSGTAKSGFNFGL
tara:strand:- start:713 stop:1996 length:1284 start_codon:yes stop_codon:yes gene_type:complete